jgi:hypothetical protein
MFFLFIYFVLFCFVLQPAKIISLGSSLGSPTWPLLHLPDTTLGSYLSSPTNHHLHHCRPSPSPFQSVPISSSATCKNTQSQFIITRPRAQNNHNLPLCHHQFKFLSSPNPQPYPSNLTTQTSLNHPWLHLTIITKQPANPQINQNNNKFATQFQARPKLEIISAVHRCQQSNHQTRGVSSATPPTRPHHEPVLASQSRAQPVNTKQFHRSL